MRPIGKRVLVKQDDAPVMEIQPEQKPIGGLVTTPAEVRSALQEAAERREIRLGYEGLEGVGLLLQEKTTVAPKKPNTGIIVAIGEEVDLKGFKEGDHVKFAGGTPEYDERGEEFLLMSQESLLLNLSKD